MNPERVRLFVALELPVTVREALIGWRGRWFGEMASLRPTAAEALHVTLCFLGWREHRDTETIASRCATVARARSTAPELRLGTSIWLPPRRPRVLAVELADDGSRLAELQADLAEVLATGGWYEPEDRPYRAHVTLARVVRGARPPRSVLPAVPELGFSARWLALYRSHLQRGGARYEALSRFELGRGDGGRLDIG